MAALRYTLKLDEWQRKVLETEGNICLRAGRQVGKSTVISVKAGEYAVKNKNKTILIIASVERQAYLLFEKTLDYIYRQHPKMIKKGKDRPTKHRILLENGSQIYSLPTGLSGYGIRGFTIDLLIADEAAFIPEEVWTSVTPMLAITKGSIILLSTPCGKSGYFYNCFNNDSFTRFHVSSEDCPRKNDQFLNEEKKRMTKMQYAQEYLGEFIDELRQFFPTELIKECMNLEKAREGHGDYFLGVDVARMGGDESVLMAIRRTGERIEMIDMVVREKTYLTEITRIIKDMDKQWNFKKIYIDDGGLGVGVFDPLLIDDQTKRKVVAINNSSRSLEFDGNQRTRLMKEDLYSNLLQLMESKKVSLFTDPEIMMSLKSIQSEWGDGRIKIWGSYSHITEALIRAAWCMRDKSLNIWIY
jgi:hypothetical protein